MNKNKLDYQITECYSNEIKKINHKLEQLEEGRIYELTKVKTDGMLATNVKQLRMMLIDMVCKIQGGEDGSSEKLEEIIKMIRY